MKYKQILPLVLLALIWGSYYVASQKSVEYMSVFSAGVLIRLLTLVLLVVIMAARKQLNLLLQVKGILRRLLLVGIFGFLIDLTAFIGLTLSPAGSGTALLKCDILFVSLISVFIYKERFSKMLSGVFMIMGIDPLHLRFQEMGDIFFILSALFVSINAFIIKSIQLNAQKRVEDNVIAFYNNFVTLVLFTGASIVMGTFDQILHPADFNCLVPVILAGIGQTLIYLVYYYNLRRYPVWIVKVFLLLMPIVSAIISFVLFGDRLNLNQCLGIGIVLVGAFGILIEQRKKENQFGYK